MTDRYSGWTNRATWNVALWVSNEKPLYDKLMVVCKELAREGCHWTDEMALEFSKEIFGSMTPDKESLDDANWQEIAEAWNEDVKWHAHDLKKDEPEEDDEGDQDAADAMKEREYLEELEAEESK